MSEDLPLPLDALVIRTPTTTPGLSCLPGALHVAGVAESRLSAESGPIEVCPGPQAEPEPRPTPTPMPAPSEAATGRQHHIRANGKANPYKPTTPEEKAIFLRQWRNPAYTLKVMGRRYHCCARTIQKWAEGFGFGPRDEAEHATLAGSIDHVAATLKDAAALAQAVAWVPQASNALEQPEVQADVRFNPLADPEIKAAMEDIQREALMMTTHSDLAPVQRKLARLSLMLASKAPAQSWPSLQDAMEALGRVFLHARKVEAQLPEMGADPVILRKEAAAQLFKELKGVLSVEEQGEMARLMKLGVDRMMGQRQPGASDALSNQALR